MITPDYYKKSLNALHRILIMARFMAYKNETQVKIAKILDYAEILPTLISADEDRTDEFQMHLEGLISEFPEMTGILQDYTRESD